MKSNQISIIVASLILGISFIVGCSLIDFQMQSESGVEQSEALAVNDSPLMTMEEASVFLHMTEDQIVQIIKTEHNILNSTQIFNGTMFPYINVDNEYIFNKELLLKWVNDASMNRSVYLMGQIQFGK